MSAPPADRLHELALDAVALRNEASLLRMQASDLVRAAEEIEALAAPMLDELAGSMGPGNEVIRLEDGTELRWVEPKPLGRRTVNTAEVDRWEDSLGPIGLGAREEPQPPKRRYPRVEDIERNAHRLRGMGLDPETFIVTPELGPAQVVIR
jgi:hypothetical protein